MRITAIQLDRYELPLDPAFAAAWDPVPRTSFQACIVRVETDAGVVGIGSGDAMLGFERFTHLFVGHDPLAIEEHVRALASIDFHAARYWPLEIALWDILAQVAGLPVATLLGGARSSIPVYASCGVHLAPEARAESALRLREEGIRALKIRVDPSDPDQGLATVAATRRAVGSSMDIIVDLNQGWRMPGDTTPALDVAAARSLVARLAEMDVLWVEEPLAGTDLAGSAQLRRDGRVRIAGGEMTRTFHESLAELDAGAFDVYQADAVLSGGLSRGRTLAQLALARGNWFTPHTWTNGIGLLANLHLVCGVGGGPYLELPYDPPAWTPERRDFMLVEPLRPDRDGLLHLPVGTGLGARLDTDRLAVLRVGDSATVSVA
jgi:L-alanine-DL-glutamate epimerase-like enolase superfamily enzyme